MWLASGSAGLGSVHGAAGSRRGQRGVAQRSPGARRKKRKGGESAGAWDQEVRRRAGGTGERELGRGAGEAGCGMLGCARGPRAGEGKRNWAGRVERAVRELVGCGGLGFLFPFLFYFLFQTKLNLFEFKFEFEFKPHSIK